MMFLKAMIVLENTSHERYMMYIVDWYLYLVDEMLMKPMIVLLFL